MSTFKLHLVQPCAQDWSAMRGDDRGRFCEACQSPVTNLSELGTDEIEHVLATTEGRRPCVRFHRDGDGALVTRARVQERVLWLLERLAEQSKQSFESSGENAQESER